MAKILNKQRREWAADALRKFALLVGIQDEDPQTQITDLITDLHHLADQHGLEWDSLLFRSNMHHDEEVT